MLDELFSEYLSRVFSSDYVGMINSARESLLNYEYSLCEANLYKTMPEDSDIDTFTSKVLLEQCLRDGFNQVFSVLGIRSKIHDIARMDQLLRAFKNLEESSDHESILNIIADDFYSEAELVEQLLSLVVLDTSFMDVVYEFELSDSTSFINRLYELHRQSFTSTSGEATEERPDRPYLERIQRFVDKYPQTIVAKKLASKDILFGETYQHYIAENGEELRNLYPNYPDRTPIEFLGLAFFANIQRHDLSGHVKTAITKFYNDLKFTTQTNIMVDKLIEEIENNGISQPNRVV